MKLDLKVVFIIFTLALSGCSEASFDLSQDSRLPKWFTVLEGMSRNNLKVTMDYYVKPSNRIAVLKLYKNGSLFPLKKVKGILHGKRPVKLKNPPSGLPEPYPSYEIITANGITDIIEHRKMEPIFYTTDDPAILKELGIQQ